MKTRAIVVGAGPVGLMLAGEIRLGGADVVVYDKLPAPSGESRALGFTKRVAEVLDQRGLLTRLGTFRWGRKGHFGGVGIDLDQLDDDHHGVLGLPQSRTEEVLAGWLAELGVPVHRGFEATGFTESADGVDVVFDTSDGPHHDHATYLIGCDGGHSTVRALAGIPAPGWESTRGMYMADVTGIDVRPRPTGEYVSGGHMVLAVGLGDGYHRILMHDGSLPPHPDTATLTYTDIADTWQRLTGESIHHGSARWMAAFPNGAALAATYRRGRVLLAGDAAHDTPPLAGWGMSTGIQDAVNLGWKLAAVLTGAAPDSLLDTYHSERHPLGEQLMRNTHAATLLYLSGEELDPLRAVIRELVTDPAAAGHFAGQVSGLGVRYDMGAGEHPMLGARLSPDRELDRDGDTPVRVADLLTTGRGLLITPTPPDAATRALAEGWAGRIDTVTGTWTPKDTRAAGPTPPEAVLVRPDGYIAWAGSGPLAEALQRWFGPARTPASV